MKTPRLPFLLTALLSAGSLGAQSINNGQFVAGLFQMDLTIPAGPNYRLQYASVLPTAPAAWINLGLYAPGFYPGVSDPGSGPVPQRYYRLVNTVPPVVAANCGVNRYGFYKKTIGPGYCMIANQLNADLGNSLNNLMPVMPDQTFFYKYTAGFGWTTDIWDFSLGGWNFGTPTLNPGEGCYICNPGPAVTVTFIGTVPEGVLTTPIAAGFNMVSSKVPQAGLVTSTLLFPPVNQDVIYTFTCSIGFQTYIYDVDLGGWDPSKPVIGVGESFWVKSAGPHPAWIRVFSACP